MRKSCRVDAEFGNTLRVSSGRSIHSTLNLHLKLLLRVTFEKMIHRDYYANITPNVAALEMKLFEVHENTNGGYKRWCQNFFAVLDDELNVCLQKYVGRRSKRLGSLQGGSLRAPHSSRVGRLKCRTDASTSVPREVPAVVVGARRDVLQAYRLFRFCERLCEAAFPCRLVQVHEV